MKKTKFTILYSIIITIAFLAFANRAYSQDAGGRAAFTRGGWVGARYVAMGKAAEVVVDDVYAIYWNPAGLSELKAKKALSPEKIKKKAEKGEINDLSEKDLINFSEEEGSEMTFQIGISGAMLDIEREAGFMGVAFNLFNGIFGAGAYSIQSTDIESYDESGTYLRDIDYNATVAFLSYGWSAGVSSVGISLKGLHEKIGDIEYAGAGLDFGARVEVIPFLNVGFVIQDVGSGLKPRKEYENIENEYDVGNPSLRLSIAFTSRESDFILAVSGVKKLQQEEYELNIGLQYDIFNFSSVYVGLNNKLFSSGLSFSLLGIDVAYAFSYDNINAGYNNLVSVTIEL